MSNPAWMPLHITDYLADTGHLTAAEHGAYLLLIMHYWQNGCLPENERLIARIARMDAGQWDESRDVLLDLLSRDGAKRATSKPAKKFRPAIPVELKRQVRARDGEKCRYCGCAEGPFDIDHDMPWSRGGKHELRNLLIACASCNRSKGALTAAEFLGFELGGRGK